MTEQLTIKQQNEIIARFMGYEKVRIGYYGCKDGDPETDETEWQVKNEDWCNKMGIEDIGDYIVNIRTNKWHEWKDVKYNSDWSWFMPVWDKFIDLRFSIPMQQLRHSELKSTVGLAILYGGIELAHNNISEAIQWYNQTIQPPQTQHL